MACIYTCRWALIKDKDVYERMVRYVDVNIYGVPRETQLRALKLIKVVLEEEGSNNGTKIFEFGYETMKHRWQKLRNCLSISKRFSLQDLPPQYCTFSQILRPPSPGKVPKIPEILCEVFVCVLRERVTLYIYIFF